MINKMISSKSKKKRVSKRLKSSWRKNAKINDVEDFLEDQRLEERLGQDLSTAANKDIFVLDTKPTNENRRLLLTRKERKLRALRPVNCFSALVPHTKVPDPIAKRNRVRTKEERKSKFVKLKEKSDRENGILKSKERQALTNRRLEEIRREKREKRGEFLKDVWNTESKFDIESDPWATTSTKKHNLRGVGISVKNVRKSVQNKPSALPAIEAPHPGMSYNPSFEAHQDLLRIVAEKEQKIIKEEQHLKRVTGSMFSKVTPEKRDKSWLVEMSQGLPSTEGTNVEENEASNDEEYSAVNPPAQNKKKTLKQRRKQREQLAQAKERKLLKMEKQKVGDIHNLKTIHKKLKTLDDKQEKLRAKRKRLSELKKNNPKVLSSVKFEERELEFNMGQDLAGNLRNLRPEGNLLADRFISMQKRNILAPAKKHHLKRGKVKRYVKPGYKDNWEATVAKANSMRLVKKKV